MKRVIVAVLIVVALTAAVAAPASAKTWKKVATLAGDTTKEGNYFKLKGGTQKLTWTIAPESDDVEGFETAAIYVMKKGTNLDDDGGIPAVWPDGAGNGSTKLHLKKGSFYLHVTSANCTWMVTLYEWR